MSLNSQQQAAVQAPNRPVLVLAGAGTGKTRILIERVVKFINQDEIDPRRILIITFTNKAKDEIRSRIERQTGEDKIPPYIFTFHAFFHHLLVKDVEKLDPKYRNFKLIDENDRRAIVRRLLKHFIIEGNDGEMDVRDVINLISVTKIRSNDLSLMEEAELVSKKRKVDFKYFLELYNLYTKELRDNNYFDYDDLEVFALKVLDVPEVRKYWSEYFKAILIDEFQDTSGIQIAIIRKITQPEASNLFCVGDPDQSIYGFRGAKPGICSEFLDEYKAHCIKLEDNYRSTPQILNAANTIINMYRTDHRLSKKLRAASDIRNDHKITCRKFRTDEQEAAYVCSEIKALLRSNRGISPKDIVILYRNNFLSKPFEMALKQANIEYSITNATEFFSRKEIKFLLSFLKLLYFWRDGGVHIFLYDVLNELKVGVGEKAFNTFYGFMRSEGLNLVDAIDAIDKCTSLSSPSKKGLRLIGEWIKELDPIKEKSIFAVVNRIIELTNYEERSQKDKAEGRMENIQQFAEHLSQLSSSNKTNRQIIEEITLRSVDVGSKKEDMVLLSTVHQAKGLEYKYVFMVKMVKTVFPSFRSKTQTELEEERRLAYVAVTRAQQKLYITFSPVNSKSGIRIDTPSLFVEEIRDLPEVEYYEHSSPSFGLKRRSFFF